LGIGLKIKNYNLMLQLSRIGCTYIDRNTH
jgi:hypothetical protein